MQFKYLDFDILLHILSKLKSVLQMQQVYYFFILKEWP